MCLTIGGIVSWLVAGTLVAPYQRTVGLPPEALNAESIFIDSESGSEISGWHCVPEKSRGVVVLVHGIRSNRLSMLKRANLLFQNGFSSILIDLQAHGESPGENITIGFKEKLDVCGAVEYARRQHPGQPIALIGVSLGGASALLASPLNIDAMVLESVYPRIVDAVDNRVRVRLGPLTTLASSILIFQLQYRLGISTSELCPIDNIRSVKCPVFILSGSKDLHTTEAETREIYEAAMEPKRLWIVDGAGHEDLYDAAGQQYEQRLIQFLEDAFSSLVD
ncbi:alpha/beta hydrolase [Stieleria sp. JC731]|uniref:alpha/beta hydrolase n=1 Tax=Stieleria sp. JC731 TaxID=2894195 RepID=UPI001E42A671|nr:alpha/beta hydrolase [Stieleria sp. JC731]MCC9602144.1 alpha/beta hydrolase [Stieleria sp. JC731]